MSDFLEKAKAAIAEKLAEAEFDDSVAFEIEGAGVVRIADGRVTLEDGDSDATIRTDSETLRELFEGGLSPTSAFVSGRIRIEGDMSVAMKLGALLG